MNASRRAARFFLVLMVLGSLGAMSVLPSVASAKGRPAGLNRCGMSRPSAKKAGWTTVRLHFYEDDYGRSADWKCRASTSKTKFYVQTHYHREGSEQAGKIKRTTFAKFRKYVPRRYCEMVHINWIWKRDSHGKRYRYIKSITASKYVG